LYLKKKKFSIVYKNWTEARIILFSIPYTSYINTQIYSRPFSSVKTVM